MASPGSSTRFFPRSFPGLVYATLSLPLALVANCAPYSRRFDVARWLAVLLDPVFRAGSALGVVRRRADSVGRTLGVVCLLLHSRRVRYPVRIDLETDAALEGPLLVVVRHSLLHQLVIRHLAERSCRVAVVMTQPFGRGHAFGTARPLHVIPAKGLMTMRRVARDLRSGHVVFLTVDASESSRTYPVMMAAPLGAWYVSEWPFRLAARLGVSVATCAHDVTRGRLRSEIRLVRSAEPAAMVREAGRRLSS